MKNSNSNNINNHENNEPVNQDKKDLNDYGNTRHYVSGDKRSSSGHTFEDNAVDKAKDKRVNITHNTEG